MNTIRSMFVVFGCIAFGWLIIREVDRAVFAAFHLGGDSTDSATKRSGLSLAVDYGTGCEYLISPYGGITPRIDTSGQHICHFDKGLAQ